MKTYKCIKTVVFSVAVAIVVAGCRTVPMTGRTQLMLSFESRENAMGVSAYAEYMQKEKPTSNSCQQEVLRRVGNALKEYTGDTGYAWEFNVLESRTINAWCLPGGKIAVYTALMKKFNNEAELACVVAHEIAHAIARHGGERQSWNYLAVLGSFGMAAIGNDTAQTIYGIGAQYGVMLPYSREHEREADSIGLTLMSKAGYNPQAAVDFWKRFSGGKSASMLDMFTSTHPCDEERIGLISSQLDDAMKLYRESPSQKGFGVKFNEGIPEAEDSKEDSGSSTSQGEVYITI